MEEEKNEMKKCDSSEQADKDKEIKKDEKVKEVEKEPDIAKKEAKENYNKLLRIAAEFENFKKRTSREMSEIRKYTNEKILLDMLTVVDNLERAVNVAPKNKEKENGLLAGVELTLKEIFRIFEKYDVKPIEAVAKPFDPIFHQAMLKEERDDYPENTVISEFQKGYMICDRLLRPSMVVVSEKKKTEEEEKNE